MIFPGPHLPWLNRPSLKSPIQHSWSIPAAFIRPPPPIPPHIPRSVCTSPLPLPLKSSEARTGAVRSVCCEINQRNNTIPPLPEGSTGGHCSSSSIHLSFIIYFILFFPCLCGDLLLSNRGMQRVTPTSGTAGAGLHVGWCPLCVCHWACTDETSVPRGAMGNDVPSTEPGVSVTI